jgi:hypothetical protein
VIRETGEARRNEGSGFDVASWAAAAAGVRRRHDWKYTISPAKNRALILYMCATSTFRDAAPTPNAWAGV